MPRRSTLVQGLLLVVLLLAGLWVWHRSTDRAASPASVAATPPSPSVGFRPTKAQWNDLHIVSVDRMPFHTTLVADGSIAFNDDHQTAVFSPYSGRVTKLFAKPGDVVKKGMPLMALDATEFVQGVSDITTAKATLTAARATEQRQHEIFESGAGALKDWRQAQADLASAQSTYTAARGRLHILGKTEAEIDALERGGNETTEARVVAPIDGTVIQRQVGLGQYIASVAGSGGSTPQFTLGDIHTMWLLANVREGDAASLRVGQQVIVHILAIPGKTFHAQVTWIGAALDPTTHRLPVRAELQSLEGTLKAGMYANFEVTTSDAVMMPAIPESAVVYEGSASRVFVARDDGSIEGRDIRVGRHVNGVVEVVDGLQPGDKVVTTGALFVDRATAND